MNGLSLYTIAQEHRAMVERLMDTQDDAQAIADTIEAESYPLEVKAQNVAYAIKNLDATASAIKSAEAEMAARRKAIEKRVEHLREYTKTCMEVAGVTKIECPHFALAIKKNPVAVDVFEPALIPAEFMKRPEPPPATPDKAAIKAALQDGHDVPGALLAQGTRLEIK
ncbi:siphovirus Gp157 family protein [Massilia sp. CT11-137]|uniref:siphovirus Gp157 family protein n=1 Tax=Massilia sp. CT11-137 TaxID=3393901 RepID=UPI0039B0F84A